MKWEEVSEQTCSIAKASSIFGDRWTLLILRQLFLGCLRFSEIQTALGITKHRLTDRLSRLIEDNIIYKHLYDERYQRFEYRLTEKGLDLYPVLITISQWGDKWECDGDGVPIEYVHTECGEVTRPQLHCHACHKPVNLRNMRLKVGPGVINKFERDTANDIDKKLYSQLIEAQTKNDGRFT